MTQKYEAIQEYEVEIAASRVHFEHHPAVRTVCYEEIDSKTLAAILIYFSALGVGMTEPVGRWIRSAGEKCGILGLPVLAKVLAAHAIEGTRPSEVSRQSAHSSTDRDMLSVVDSFSPELGTRAQN